jgi:AraC family transcriptional regulator
MNETRVEFEREGTRATRALLGEHEVTSLEFPPGSRLPAFEIERGYLAVVLEGALVKTFSRSERSLDAGSFVTLPPGATHATAFGPRGARIVVVRNRGGTAPSTLEPVVRRLRHVRATSTAEIGRRLAAELRANDSSWSLAAEGLVLQLLAATTRAPHAERRSPARSRIQATRELLHEAAPDTRVTLGQLAETVGLHPSHLARSFRREFGQSVGEYARGLRLEWAATELALGEASLGEVAIRAGFADQSHFTRAFRRHAGVTPGRYRRLLRG